jgi:adenosylmethionine-8-amino-7-oxononanoate aminotransferase
MSSVFYRNPQQEYPRGLRGEGVYLYDTDGKQYLDGSGGAAVSCLGHWHPYVIAAIKRQVEELAYAHTAFFTNDPQEKLAKHLSGRFGEEGARVYFLSGGSEANEAAIKLARMYSLARGHDAKHIIVSRKQSYHGNTLGALSMSGNPGRRDIYAPMLHDWPKIEPCYAYRHQRDDESADAYGLRSAQALEGAIDEHGAEQITAFVAETVVGATMGAVPPVGDYMKKIREICDRHDILLILDEVMAGCGRTGTYFSFEQDGVQPDIVTVAKGLGGGYQPIGAAVARKVVHDTIVERFGSFYHGHTYIGHATACAAALAVAKVVYQEDLLDNVNRVGAQLREALAGTFAEHPLVGDIRGRGLLIGIELVADRADKTPASPALASHIKGAAMKQGLIIYPGGGTADGRSGAHILLAPPFIYESAHVDELVTKLATVLPDDHNKYDQA